MVPSFITEKSVRRSSVKRRKAVRVISFSGSSLKSWKIESLLSFAKSRRKIVGCNLTYVAFEESTYLLLDNFGLPEQALVHC
jgi:hypothetical protein